MGKGLYDKYLIEKADGTQIDPNARYFILRYDKDPAAWFALKSYAGHTHNPELRRDLFAELRKYWGDHLKESHFASLDNLYRLEDDNRLLLGVARAAQLDFDDMKCPDENKPCNLSNCGFRRICIALSRCREAGIRLEEDGTHED